MSNISSQTSKIKEIPTHLVKMSGDFSCFISSIVQVHQLDPRSIGQNGYATL